MKRILSIALALLIFSMISSCGGEAETNNNNLVVRTNVKVSVIETSGFSNYLETIGIVLPLNDVPIFAEEGGTLVKIVRKKGSFVQKGRIIAVLQNKILASQLAQGRAAYLSDSLNYEQQKELVKVNGISNVALKQSEYRRDMSKANYELLQTRYSKLWIKAPISGLLDQRYFDYGVYVPPMSKYGHLVDMRKVKIKVDMPERYAGLITINSPVKITFDAFKDFNHDGKANFVGNVIENKSRTFPVEILLDNADGHMKSNMVANVNVQLFTYEDRIVIPKDAIVDQGEKQFAYLHSGGYALEREVIIEDVYRDKALISHGLQVGDSLIVTGNRDLVDSTYIRIVE